MLKQNNCFNLDISFVHGFFLFTTQSGVFPVSAGPPSTSGPTWPSAHLTAPSPFLVDMGSPRPNRCSHPRALQSLSPFVIKPHLFTSVKLNLSVKKWYLRLGTVLGSRVSETLCKILPGPTWVCYPLRVNLSSLFHQRIPL